MPGPPPKPTHLKLVTGNPGKRRLNANEPKPDLSIPRVPPHLSDNAKVEWGRISDELLKLGLMTNIDRAALAAYCQAWSDWVEAEGQLQKFGKVVRSPAKTLTRTDPKTGKVETETSGGYPMPSPFLAIRNKALDLMRQFLTEFGMTPASRSRISVESRQQTQLARQGPESKAGKYF